MSIKTQSAPHTATAQTSALHQVAKLVRRAEAGQPLAFEEVAAFTRAPDPAARALAKRLMAHMVISQARQDASRLLCEACADLDFRHDGLLDETLVQLFEFGMARELFDVQVRAAEAALQRRDHDAALVHAQNALGADTKHGDHCGNDPHWLRKLIAIYERTAAEAPERDQVAPARRRSRRSPAGGKLRMAHVVCQLVDAAHGPSHVIESMLKLADRERFDNYLVVTEAIVQHGGQRHQMLTTPPSTERGPQRMERIQRGLGVPILMPRATDTFLRSAVDLHHQMAEHQIDVAFFHGSMITPTDWLLCAWQAAPWQFDRGFGKPLLCPAVNYQFFELEPTMETMAFLCRERGIPYGLSPDGAADISDCPTEPFDRGTLGIPEDHVILGTVGNHLADRMGPAFCETIAKVMCQCPQTTYLIVGEDKFRTQLAIFGRELVGNNGPGSRVRFLGHSDEATRWTNTFDVYVNEYPGGGGTSVYEAMALAKPVVCMRTNSSSISAAGAVYVGEENLVKPATNETYAQRLIELIKDPEARRAFGQKLQQRQRTKFDPQAFVRGLTDTIWEFVSADLEDA